MKTKVDILLPFWGDVDLFKQAVISVLGQTDQDWRLLIFDDHYPSDEPEKYIRSLSDARITYYRHAQNIGITNNFNFAIEQASSDYCIMLGCDDIMLPDYLERSLSTIGEASFYQPGVKIIDAKGKIYMPLGDKVKQLLRPKKSGIYSGEKLATSLCHGNWLYFPSILWKTSTIKKYGFNADYKIAEDLALQLQIIIDGGTVFLDNQYTFMYRRFSSSLSSKEKGKGGVRFAEEDAVYRHFSKIFKNIGWKKAALAANSRITSRLHRLI